MSKDDFEITPGCYDRQLDAVYRYSSETVSFGLLEEAKGKCSKWLAQNAENFHVHVTHQ